MEKWAASSWAKKLKTQETRKNMTDFDRFKAGSKGSTEGKLGASTPEAGQVKLAKQKRAKEVKKAPPTVTLDIW